MPQRPTPHTIDHATHFACPASHRPGAKPPLF